MKTEEEIRNEIVKLRKELTNVQNKHKALNQIDMLSGEGSALKAKENFILGQLGFGTWVIIMIMKKLIAKVRIMHRFYKWYVQYVKSNKKPTVGFIGYGNEYQTFVYLNPHLNVIWIKDRASNVGRTFDFVIRYGPDDSFNNSRKTDDLLELANAHTSFRYLPR